jgi:hypothetical protein
MKKEKIDSRKKFIIGSGKIFVVCRRKDEQCEIIYLLRAARCKSIFLYYLHGAFQYSVSTIYWQFSIRTNMAGEEYGEKIDGVHHFLKSIKLILLSFNYSMMVVSHLLPTQNSPYLFIKARCV